MNIHFANSIAVLLAALGLLTAASAGGQQADTATNPPAVSDAAKLIAARPTNLIEVEATNAADGLQIHGRIQSRHQRAGAEPIVKIGQDHTVGAGKKIDDLVVISGRARIEGEVSGDVVVVLGSLELASNSVVNGAAVVVGGSATVASNAVVKQEMVVVGGSLDAEPGFKPGGEQVVVGFEGLGEQLAWLLPWLQRGLLWGRPIVPELGWVWIVAAIIFLVHFLLNLLFDRSLRVCTDTLNRKPFTALLVGLLVLLLAGPVFILLIATGIGLVVVPFVLCALVLAAVFGKIAVARWIGGSVARHGTEEQRFAPVRSFLIGALVIYLLYMIPVVGIAVWAMTRLIGLGAATLAFVQALKRERPAAAPVHVAASAISSGPPVVPIPPTVSSASPADLTLLPRASFPRRLLAAFLDVVLVTLLCGVLGGFNHDGPTIPLLAIVAYHIAFWTWRSTTIGGIICNLRVVRVDGQPLRFGDAAVRGLSAIFSVMIFFLGFLWMLWDGEKQTWHDRIAGTYVVVVPKSSPLL